MESLEIAVVQASLHWEDRKANLAKLTSLIATAPAVDLVVLPEMYSTGFTMDPTENFETMDGDAVQWMVDMAESMECALVGSLVIKENEKFYNRMLFVGPEGLVAQYDKKHLFSLAGEDKMYTGGTQEVIVEYKEWKICLQVCYDLRFPAYSRKRGEAGYDLLIYSANWPAPRAHHWKTLLMARAIENQAYCVGCNRIGEDDNGFAYQGDSAIISPRGERLVTATDISTVLTAGLDPEALKSYRKSHPFWQDADDFKLL